MKKQMLTILLIVVGMLIGAGGCNESKIQEKVQIPVTFEAPAIQVSVAPVIQVFIVQEKAQISRESQWFDFLKQSLKSGNTYEDTVLCWYTFSDCQDLKIFGQLAIDLK